MAIALRKPNEIAKLKKAGEIVGKTLQYLQNTIKPGMTLKQIDEMGETYLRNLGAEPSFKGLYGFTGSVCTSLNNVCIHGVPTDEIVKEGDILGLDIGSKLDGYYGDAAVTMAVGEISKKMKLLLPALKMHYIMP
jgi:methionyl aminopeptidase